VPNIRIDEDVYQALKTIAEPFIDSPSSVIRRLLIEKGVMSKSSEDLIDIAGNSATPQHVYELFLLRVLLDTFNGSGGKLEVTKKVMSLMKNRGFIGPLEMTMMATGQLRAKIAIISARNALKEKGLIVQHSPRGMWNLTEAGKERARNVIPPRRR
jgi:predicted CopG family antitoxin